MKRVVHAACPHDCPDACSVLITIEDGRATKIQGDPRAPGYARVPVRESRQVSGPRVLAGARALSHEYERRRRGLLPCGKGGWGRPSLHKVRLSAFPGMRLSTKSLVAFAGPLPSYGCESILPYSYGGTLGALNGASMDRRFFHRLGASQLERSICSSAGEEGLKSVIGVKLGTEPEQFAHSRYIIAWGVKYSRQQRSSLALYRRGSAQRREAGGDRSLPHAYREAAPTGTCRSIPAPMPRWRSD